MPLHIDYRPKTLEEFVGNLDLKENIASILQRQDKPHAMLFMGPSGTGKTTLARIIAKAMGCEDIDLYEYNSASVRGIDSIRDIEEKARLAPKGPCKFYILDEIHQQTPAAQETMLKMLEEAPKHCYYILATTNPEKLTKAMQTRVTTFSTSPLTTDEMTKLLNSIIVKEHIKITPLVIEHITRAADGLAREGVKLLDQVKDMKNEEEQINLIKSTFIGEAQVIQICRRVYKTDSGFQKWVEIRKMLSSITDNDSERVRIAVYTYLGKVLKDTKTGQGMYWILLLQEEFSKPIFHLGRVELENQFCKACMVQFPKEEK